MGEVELADEVRAWVAAAWSEDLTLRTWWRRLADAGWAFPSWPIGLGGRGLAPSGSRLVSRELSGLGVVGPPGGYAVTMTAPTLLRHATPAQQVRWVPAIARGEVSGCQLFSEPDAGSDLASLRTRAVRSSTRWSVSGQKVWSSGAIDADLGMLLARTDPLRARHRGITYFLLDMGQPGVTVRPLRQMNGLAEFNEVFLDGAQVTDDERIGEEDDGWRVAQTTLASERAAVPPRGTSAPAGSRAGWLGRTVGDVLRDRPDDARSPTYPISGRATIRLAKLWADPTDPLIRQAAATNYALSEVSRWTARRAVQGLAGGAQIAKLQAAELARRARDVDLLVTGAAGTLVGDGAPEAGEVALMALSAHRVSIGGGTDQIQKNILAERTLGLPREPTDVQGVIA